MNPEKLLEKLDTGKYTSVFENSKFKKTEDAEGDKPEVKQRIKALKKIQVEMTKVEAGFYEEMHDLECKYLAKCLPFFEKRRKIVLGDYEPSVEECDFVGGSDSEGENTEKEEKLDIPVDQNANDTKATGIPNFWLTIIRNVDMLAEILEDDDEPILKHLVDVTVEMLENPMGFKILFHFSPNEYFTDPVLIKTYEMNCVVDEDDPFTFDGPEIIRCQGCPIHWCEGKNITLKTISKKQKHKQNNTTRVVSKTVNAPSFFNFFNPPEINPDLPLDEEIQMQLNSDFEIGQYIRLKIIPRAVLYYTGEALEDDFELDDSSSGSEEDDDIDGDDESVDL